MLFSILLFEKTITSLPSVFQKINVYDLPSSNLFSSVNCHLNGNSAPSFAVVKLFLITTGFTSVLLLDEITSAAKAYQSPVASFTGDKCKLIWKTPSRSKLFEPVWAGNNNVLVFTLPLNLATPYSVKSISPILFWISFLSSDVLGFSLSCLSFVCLVS